MFEVLELAARGGSSEVYRALDTRNGRLAALKLPSEKNSVAAISVQQESDVLSKIRHPHVVSFSDAGTHDGLPFLATSWVEGRTLSHLITTEGPLPVARATKLVGQLASAVNALHEAGVVHGDLTPNNMVVDLVDHLTVIDMGSSHPPPDEQPSVDVTSDLATVTTPRYVAPEVVSGSAGGAAADQYAVALIAYELLTGQSPYPDVPNPTAMLGHHLATDPTPPSEVVPGLDEHIDAVLLRGLAKDPQDRFVSADAFAAALAGNGPASRETQRFPTVRSRRIPAVGLVLAVVAVVAISVLVAARDDGGSSSDATATAPASLAEPTGGPSATAQDTQADPVGIAADPVVDGELGPAGWTPGTAAGLVCNRLQVPGFEQNVLPDDFYPQDNAEALVPGAGVDGSTALRVGGNGSYSLYSEIIPVEAGLSYVFSSWIRQQGEPQVGEMFIGFLSPDYVPIEPSLPALDVTGVSSTGTRHVLSATAPADAAFAVPTLYKDGSPGWLLADEIVFAEEGSCPVELGP